jgi:hypothetical protein
VSFQRSSIGFLFCFFGRMAWAGMGE